MCGVSRASCSEPLAGHLVNVPASQVYQAQVDIYDACGNEIAKSVLEAKVWEILLKRTRGLSIKEKVLLRMSAFAVFIL